MPKPTEKGYGGRKKGSKNKATIQRETIMARVTTAAMPDSRSLSSKKLAKEVLEEAMIEYGRRAAYHAMMMEELPPPEANGEGGEGEKQTEQPVIDHAEEYLKFKRLEVDAADRLAPYQSPKFLAQAIFSPDTSQQIEMVRVIERIITDDPNVRVHRTTHSDSPMLPAPAKPGKV
jgi:hypothetical protein